MEYKEAIKILLRLLDKDFLNVEEKKAVQTAIGTLDCGSLGENRVRGMIKARKVKRDKDINQS